MRLELVSAGRGVRTNSHRRGLKVPGPGGHGDNFAITLRKLGTTGELPFY